jgi:GAF domain-containing protein
VLEVENKRDNTAFCDGDVEMLTTLAAQAAVAIENAELYHKAQREIEERKRAGGHGLGLSIVKRINEDIGRETSSNRRSALDNSSQQHCQYIQPLT